MASIENLAVVVPVLNEANSIQQFCEDAKALQTLALKNMFKVEFIFVDNGSTDNSFQMLTEQCSRNPGFSLLTCKTRGYGAALKTGFLQSKGDYVGFIDLDSTYPLQDFVTLAETLRKKPEVQMAIGSRMNSGSQMPLVRKIGNTLYKVAIQFLYLRQIPDACSGMRVVRKDHKSFLVSQSNNGLGYSIQLTCFSLRNKWALHFHSIAYNERTGPSKLNVFRDGFDFLKEILRERFKSAHSV